MTAQAAGAPYAYQRRVHATDWGQSPLSWTFSAALSSHGC